MTLNGIDIASWQAGLVPQKMTSTRFIIVKATGGMGYKNEYFKDWADKTLACGKLLGIYHFARDRGVEGTAQQEADHFISAVKPYVGKATLWLDWEEDAVALGPAWAKAFLDRVYAKTGVKPGIYMSKSVCNEWNWTSVMMAGYPLWVAQYPNYEKTGYQTHPWTDSSPFGAWGKPILFQYTSSGRVAGYGADLDLDLFYGNTADWGKLTMLAGKASQAVAKVVSKVTTAKTSSGVNYLVLADPSLNVRKKRSTNSESVGTFKKYTVVQLKSVKTNKYGNIWGQIAIGKNKGKYVAIKFGGKTLAVKKGKLKLDTIANEVIAGAWGNGDARVKALEKAGYNPVAMQKRVNELLS